MVILVHKGSNSGAGGRKWEVVEKALTEQGVAFDARFPSSEEDCVKTIMKEIKGKQKVFIAAGGDGTANLVLNTIMDPATDKPRADVAFGAIGLGSSNDFHKPFDQYQEIDGVPLRIDYKKAKAVDLGKIIYTDTQGSKHTRYFILNGSIGFIAEGNAYFNSDKKIKNWLNSKNTDLAITWTILVNLLTYKNFKTLIELDGKKGEEHSVTTLSILKKVQFSGDFLFDTPVVDDDGMFDVNLLEDMGKFRLIKTISALSKGKFSGLPSTRAWRARKIRLVPEKPVHIEADGEVNEMIEAELTVIPKILKVCR